VIGALAGLAGALAILTLGAEALVRGSVAIAKRFGLSSFFVGLTIVGFGTSTPELATSLLAAWRGQGDLAVGNVVGSNTFNICVILGVTALVCPIPVALHVVRRETWVVCAAALAPYLALAGGGTIGRGAGAFMLAALAAYVWRGYRAGVRAGQGDADDAAERELEQELGITTERAWWRHPGTAVALVAAGLALLVVGSRLLVTAASTLGRGAGMSELAIGLTIVAAGTSAPELMTSIVAALRRQSDIAVGNILGSNVFNMLGILGVTCVVAPQVVSPQVLWLDAPVMLAASLALLPIMTSQARISRLEGGALLLAFVGYVWVLLARAPGWFG
jgi:cation:H+ antiporter